ncbi:hypothetical protein SCP_0803220 [Sparassis crispa]|uniref:Uncharacterized protein n=1 Tax=Sparassis crispa TaxID=139825 RepID=A0A401GUD7_9APHY|nr:hypothetical protein SCP_0803220 [Sparassis crispa]GBE85800.1 hypothetical protein SCP_0803220 [Sparassis crispa]
MPAYVHSHNPVLLTGLYSHTLGRYKPPRVHSESSVTHFWTLAVLPSSSVLLFESPTRSAYCDFITCDASDFRTGALLSYGVTLETARPVAFESCTLKGAELNYPVHEKELLAIVRALRKWHVDLLRVPFTVYTDHRTLENFFRQKELSRRQARWQEFLAQYDFDIKYIKGEENIAADVLSRIPPDTKIINPLSCGAILLLHTATLSLCAIPEATCTMACASSRLSIASDPSWLTLIHAGYHDDKWCVKLRDNLPSVGVREQDGLLYVGDRLVIPHVQEIREGIFRLAHDTLGHFGFDKSYAAIRDAYYWPHMRKELEELYVPSCEDCQRNKSSTQKPPGPLHPLPVPPGRCDSIAIDFVGPLPEDDGFDCLATITDHLNSDIRLIPTWMDVSAEAFAAQFFDHWYCENGLPLDIISDRDKLFVSRFWKSLHRLTGVKLKMSSAYHPQTDGSSERSNKTVIQALRYHVARNQRGWVRALPRVRFTIMNTVNESTGFSPFQLLMGHSPRIIPLLLETSLADDPSSEADLASRLIASIETDVLEAQDNLFLAKVNQVALANCSRGDEIIYNVGDRVLLSTFHRRRDYMQRGDHRVAKFMVRFDGPYSILHAYPESSVYTLDLPPSMHIFPTFHSSLLKPWKDNDASLFPSRQHSHPGPLITEDGVEEWEVKTIVDHRPRGRGFQYLVRFKGYGPEHDVWLPGREVNELATLDSYLLSHPH